ncbi:GerAB/ArcD/ProY family transporter [Blautia segnis]|uniref:GerAB/ArcD/ProY family transporter n=1 Tax=Blautia segnis TaxID=2763030 RepID=A0A8I0DR14_9FIRM|nr:GerAB/ArcD/ProY family transporter [Blautia segnis]MBC5650167.1 GerAB/ArcD/ProY family transporter [Blautia segnis]
MKFAENNRISQRQLYRQIVIAFIAPFLLCLFRGRRNQGLSGLTGTLLAVAVFLFYVIFLIRLGYAFANPCKTAGKILGRLMGIFYLVYCILGAAFLLDLLGEIVSVSLGTGVQKVWLCVIALIVCSLGTHRGIQRRGRIGEVSGGLVLVAVVLMLLLSAGQGRWEYFQEMLWNSEFSGRRILQSGYYVICAFSGLSLLPFLLEHVEKKGNSGNVKSIGKTVVLAVVTLGVLLILAELLLPAVFGWGRLRYENYPILPLLAGADLPGNVLARFDVLWMGFLLYSLLFSVGSFLHYGHLIVEKTGLGTGRVWIGLLVFVVMVTEVRGIRIRDYFEMYLGCIFVPGMLIIQIIFFIMGKKRWKKKAEPSNLKKRNRAGWGKNSINIARQRKAAEGLNLGNYVRRCSVVVIILGISLFTLSGCGGVEPEKRMYPLALGADIEDRKFQLTYGVPDLPKATGQEKNGEDQGNAAPSVSGDSFQEIEQLYSRTQEKYLDMGHLEILVLGQSLLDGGRWEQVLEYLKQEPTIGENVYVFRSSNAAEAVGWGSPQETSLGEYLLGLLENNPDGSPSQAVTLRELYHEMYDRGALPALPDLIIQGEELEVVF